MKKPLEITREHRVEVMTESGAARFEFSMRRQPTTEEKALHDEVIERVGEAVADDDYKVLSTASTILDDGHHFLFEVAGPQTMDPRKVRKLQSRIGSEHESPVHLYFHLVRDSVVTGSGYTSWGELLTSMGRRTREAYEEETQQMLEEWR